MTNNVQSLKEEPQEHSKLIMASYGSRELFGQWIAAAFGFTAFFYYEVVIGLNVVLAATAYVLYSIWNAVNDPLLGYLMERIHMPWEKKWGLKRFPWLLIAAFPWAISFAIIFMVPQQWDPITNPGDNLPVFLWFLSTICIYDTFNSLFDVNVLGLYPEKFQGLDERRTVQGFGTILGVIGLVLAATIPPMFITTGVRATYQTSALVTTSFGMFILIFALPGVWEDKKTRERNIIKNQQLQQESIENFFNTAKSVLSNKTFLAKVTLFFGYQVAAVMLQNSAFYIVTFLLNEGASTITLLLGGMLLGALASVPLWVYFSHKLDNNKKISIAGAILMLIAFVPMIFVSTLLGWVILLVLFGIGLGGQWFSDPPTISDVIDADTLKTGKRRGSIYFGYQLFFIRLGYATIAITIAIVHTLTGFVEGASSLVELRSESPTPDLALFGIRIHSVIVPAIFILVTVLLFWRFYDLTPAKVKENRKKLKELNF